jgi:outer membrane protein assembly factor BamB
MRRVAIVMTLAAVLALGSTGVAQALPQYTPDDTYMLNQRARALIEVGDDIWAGGRFTGVLNTTGQAAGSAGLLAVFGADGTSSSVVPPSLSTGTGDEVFDLEVGPDGTLYAAGKFAYTKNGANYRNLVGIDPTTGQITRTFRTPSLRAVFATADRVYAGGAKLTAYTLGGTLDSGFAAVTLLVDDSIRGHGTAEFVRDIRDGGNGWFVATGQFDFINGDPQKVMFRFNPVTGAFDPAWQPSDIAQQAGAWGSALIVDGSTIYVGAGGSDFTSAYNVSNAQLIWRTDTSGSTQAVSVWDADTLVIGGHWEWIEDDEGDQCGSNQAPHPGTTRDECWFQPRLVALDRTTGHPIKSWIPTVCCAYNGVWTTLVEDNRLHIGGEFAKVGGITQKYYARLAQLP